MANISMKKNNNESIELTVLIPCLNEEETIERVINKALNCMKENSINGEVLIADNGSNDRSIEIAISAGARVINVSTRGYGAALIEGTKQALGKYCIMGDADDSYDFSKLMPYLEKLREGYDLVMGNRFKGGIEKGAMPFLHKYLGTPVISFLGRLFYHNKIGDFNCGMRGYDTEKIKSLNLKTTGMEYASEMIVMASLNGLKIAEVPTTLSVDGRSRRPYLRTWSDGWRHLKFLLLHSPNWLFLYPGIALIFIGIVFSIILVVKSITIGNVTFDINTLFFASMAFLMGINMFMFSAYTKVYARETQYIPMDKVSEKIAKITTEKMVLIGGITFVLGLIAAIVSVCLWNANNWGNLNPEIFMRITIPSGAFMVAGLELLFGGFFVGILRIK